VLVHELGIDVFACLVLTDMKGEGMNYDLRITNYKLLFRLIFLLLLILCTPISFVFAGQENAVEDPDSSIRAERKKIKVPFFDGIKLQTTNCYPKLTNANHMIENVNDLTGSSLRDWDTIIIQTIDVVLWKDLSKYFKTDFAVAVSTGSLVSSSNGFRGTPLEMGIRMRQRYSVVEFWTNFYFYPFTTDYKDEYKSGHVIEPFIAAGFGYTFFRSESVFKLRKGGVFYNRIRNNWNGGEWATKLMTGFNVNLGNVSPKMDRWVITFSAFLIWNRLKGHSNMHLTDGLQVFGRPVDVNLQKSNRMDIDLSGSYFSLAIGRYF
jgi:hypothetical protein